MFVTLIRPDKQVSNKVKFGGAAFLRYRTLDLVKFLRANRLSSAKGRYRKPRQSGVLFEQSRLLLLDIEQEHASFE